jgi:Helicase HerA, central domain/TraM recognition site of TraD and TraG
MLESAPIGIHADKFFGEPDFSVPADARRKHMALFGGTGTGKSTLLMNMAASDLAAGTGITVVDPHGGLSQDLLTNHIPRHRKNDVIFFDPKNHTHSVALNVLDCPRPEQRGLVVSNVVSIFNKLWAESWGPRLEDILRNSLWALIEQPAPTSLLALPKLLTDEGYRADLLRHVENPSVLDFFINTFARWTSSFREEAISPVLNKCRAFLTDPLMRATIGQTRSSFNFRWMMDHRKILLCDLAKGSIGDDNSKLLGSLIVLKEKLAALSRQDVPEPERVPHVLFCEEAHNFIGDFESILAESRKYALLLILATQGIEALQREAAFAIFSNCATVISFRVSGTDATRLRDEFGMVVPASSLQDLADYTMYVRTLTRGASAASSPSGPHYVAGYPPFQQHPRHALRDSTIRVSQARYAKPRPVVDENLKREFFNAAPKIASDRLHSAQGHV